MTTTTDATHGSYRIGAVARLTGISPDTLRIWERRYDIVKPERTPKGGRLYSHQDVTRLTMIKTLVDQGYAISTVANLAIEELSRRLNSAQPANLPPPDSGQHEVCVIGQAISVRACNTEGMPQGLELAGAYSDLDAFLEDETTCDTLVIEMPFLDRPIARELNNPELRRRAQRIIVMYAFSPSNIVSQLQRYGLQTLRAPVAIEHIWQHCQLSHTQQVDWQPPTWNPRVASAEPIPPKRFDTHQLIRLSEVTTSLECECPHHMASIIEQLSAFEEYSARCEVATKQDAALHGYLHQMTARARWLMEVALERLAEVEGIRVDAAGNTGN
ncbi:MAG: MerR family transcriptional regulator [Gammaproteobacteria bacterium]|nr:MerR family transcriptional regulator [Gammaproteobacteria bacterium]MCP5317507.1 MerR family transcriptional regulator [Chromatiaceae bacterium]MCP5436178.1 MerR family transcriptional regulator [Chromatiaceae bacterium]